MKPILFAAALSAIAGPVAAEVAEVTPQGFAVTETIHVRTPPDRVWQALIQPNHWWSPEHTYSNSAASLSLEPKAGGCFCEQLAKGGSVQHLTVVYAAPGQALRLRGALGPLQGEGVDGALTFELKPETGGVALTRTYAVGGYLRGGFAKWAPLVDGMLHEQLARLKTYAETGAAAAPPSDPALQKR